MSKITAFYGKKCLKSRRKVLVLQGAGPLPGLWAGPLPLKSGAGPVPSKVDGPVPGPTRRAGPGLDQLAQFGQRPRQSFKSSSTTAMQENDIPNTVPELHVMTVVYGLAKGFVSSTRLVPITETNRVVKAKTACEEPAVDDLRWPIRRRLRAANGCAEV